MPSTRSSSSDSTSSPGSQQAFTIGTNPNSRAYAPDMDSLVEWVFGRMRDTDHWTKNFLVYQCFSFEGSEIVKKEFPVQDFEEMIDFCSELDENIHLLKLTQDTFFLFYATEFRELCNSLDFAPWISHDPDHYILRGLGRRVYGSYYDIWFTLPLIGVSRGKNTYQDQELGALLIDPTGGEIHLIGDVGIFYLSFNTETKQTRILFSDTVPADERLTASCERPDLGGQDDPFIFVTCALSSILQDQGVNGYEFSLLEDYSNSLKFEITEEEEVKVKETAIQLRQCLPYMEKISESVECMIQIVEDTLNEHMECRDLLSVPQQPFIRVQKNLQTLRSRAFAFKTYQEKRIRRINVCLSTLSSLLSLRADSAIKANTEAMTRLTEANREDSGKMNDIAIATKLDSEAMITIAKLTMFYLPATFVATLFSMGIFNFDFDDGKNGRLYISSQWWLYIIFAIPLTLGTFYWFRAATRSHKQASKKAEREAKQPE
ncbi:hypothetical protein FOC1_g10006403 [Fusarium oxysporum f. sp. cubense race 1]|uniref:Uncharacterized protein n=1 Tax=Fusarium oxysporum f. sp. cubense (strain race 1) TaxID=1229664 RepID=N4TUM4_FUSC1|nr:hypothetical protein FOC1_g10006403 [Fusarium oxysporum f. sp. cubense race 1]